MQEAAALLKESGLFAGNIDERVSDEREGIVLEQIPPENTMVNLRTSVDIVFSVQTAAKIVEVPNLINMNPDEAIMLLKENRLNYARKEINQLGKEENTVTDQVPQAGILVPEGTEVTIFIQQREQNNAWIFWGTGIAIAAALGALSGFRLKIRKGQKKPGRKDVKPKIHAVWDLGKQTITCTGDKLTGKHLQIRYVKDTGIQSIKTEKDDL